MTAFAARRGEPARHRSLDGGGRWQCHALGKRMATSFTLASGGTDASGEPGRPQLVLGGQLRLADGNALLRELRRQLPPAPARARIDLSGVESADGGSIALMLQLCDEHAAGGGAVEMVGASAGVQRMLDLYANAPPPARTAPAAPRLDFVAEVGRAAAGVLHNVKQVFGFAGQLMVGLVAAVRRPRSVHWRELGLLMERAGADGVPIVVVINFLVGLIMGYQAAIQLARFGADVFIADLVGLSITRELAPLMTAIIVAGRSGAAYAAELGTMQVREEIDALQTLGLEPARFLVFPRITALVLVVPLLVLLGDAVGCLGGLAVATATLDLTVTGYVHELEKAVDLWDVFGGVIKSCVFAVTIALIACQRGLTTRGGAAAVGDSTTSAVVITLFALVGLDAGFAILWKALGI